MSADTLSVIKPPLEPSDLVPQHYDTDLIVTPEDNPVVISQTLDDLRESVREHGQLVPGWVCPSPDLPEGKRLCLEGNRRLAVARLCGLRFWAFDIGRFVLEEERIRLTFQHNHSRRVMGREEIAQRAARFIDLTDCTQAEAARELKISGPTLSRAFGDKRIPPELRPKAESLGLSIRSLIAALPATLMPQALDYATTAAADGKLPIRNQVALYNRGLKRNGTVRGSKPKSISLRHGGRLISFSVVASDSATAVAEELKAIAAKLGKHADVPPDGWPFLFQ